MIRADQIPPEVVKAYKQHIEDNSRTTYEAALAAAINAWPGSEPLRRKNGQGKGVFLPFPKENTND